MRMMSSEELRQLKRGDTLVIKGKVCTVKSKGRKWITLEDSNETIDIARARTSHPNYPQWENSIYADIAAYIGYTEYCIELDNSRKTLRTFISSASNECLLKVASFIENLDKEKEA